ncbi:MAG: hypothetical protein KIS66_02255 [Fimbriimonadaceae bacterium]|nr:hypothetical protein [Fimbriimonadaceae bacterium]
MKSIATLASEWHGGQSTALYSLASTGQVCSVSHARLLVAECSGVRQLRPVLIKAESVLAAFESRWFGTDELPIPALLRRCRLIAADRSLAEEVCDRLGMWDVLVRLRLPRVDVALEYAAHCLAAHGVESIDGNYNDPYWQNAQYLYVNRGDPYDPTVLYDCTRERFFSGCWGDVVEKHGRRRGIV